MVINRRSEVLLGKEVIGVIEQVSGLTEAWCGDKFIGTFDEAAEAVAEIKKVHGRQQEG